MAITSAVPTEYFHLVNKTHLRPHLEEPLPNPQMLSCVDAVLCHSSLGSMRLPIVLPYLLGPSDCQEHICSVEYIEAVRMMSFK